jgi:Tol biopolymer transport system component
MKLKGYRVKKHKFLLWTLLIVGLVVSAAWLLIAFKPAAAQSSATTLLVSVASDGTPANAWSDGASLSPNGRYVGFDSWATNLVISDTNNTYDVFVHDMETHQTINIAVASDGTQSNALSGSASFSANGRFIAFYSEADSLVPDDTNEAGEAFIHDQQTHGTTRVVVASNGDQADEGSTSPAISGDGRWIVFSSSATNLTTDATSGILDVFVHDQQTGQTSLISQAINDSRPNDYSDRPALSADGHFVAFRSNASNLVEDDTNGVRDIFVHDRQTGETTRASRASDGTQADEDASPPALSADGRFVAFSSRTTNLVPGDTNRYCPIDGDPNPNCADVFVHDRHTGQTERVSLASDGTQSNASSGISYMPPALSADGRFVAFWSAASNLVPGDTNEVADIFVHDRLTHHTERVSVAEDGSQAEHQTLSVVVDISDDGRVVAFGSSAKLVSGEVGGGMNVYVRVRDVAPSAVSLVSLTTLTREDSSRLLLLLSGLLLILVALRRK